MITSLQLQDFKAFHSLELPLRPLTVLIGPNNAGKSAILAALRLLAQTMQSSDRSVPLVLDGPFGDFGTYRDLVHGNHRGRPMGITFAIADEDGETFSCSMEFKYRTQRRELILQAAEIRDSHRTLVRIARSRDSDRPLVTNIGGRSVPSNLRGPAADLLGLLNFIPRFAVWFGRDDFPLGTFMSEEEFDDVDGLVDHAAYSLSEALEHLDYLGPMRVPPERTYHQTGVARARIGAQGENWMGLYVRDAARRGSRNQFDAPVTDWLRSAGLAQGVSLNWLSDRHYEVQIEHPISGEHQNLADVGQGNSQVLPVLLGGLHLNPGDTFLVEEPEIHLHPRAQAAMGDFFLLLHARGVQTLIETHSEYLILRLQQHIAAGRLLPENVIFYYVHALGANKTVEELRVDDRGRFERPLEDEFFPERLEEARELARIRSKTKAI